MDIQNVFRLKWGIVEIEISGDSVFVSDSMKDIASILETTRTALRPAGASPTVPAPTVPFDPNPGSDTPQPAVAGASSSEKPLSLVEFLNTKNPHNQAEEATCIAYYKEKSEHIESFGRAEMTEWWKMTKLKMPGNMTWVLTDACTKSFLTALRKDCYRVTATGDSMVERLGPKESDPQAKPRAPRSSKPRKAAESEVLKVSTRSSGRSAT